MTNDEKAKRIDAWNAILEFLKNVDASKLHEFNFDLKRELRQDSQGYYSRSNACGIKKEIIELKFTIDHDIEG